MQEVCQQSDVHLISPNCYYRELHGNRYKKNWFEMRAKSPTLKVVVFLALKCTFLSLVYLTRTPVNSSSDTCSQPKQRSSSMGNSMQAE